MKPYLNDDMAARKIVSSILVEHSAFTDGANRLIQPMKVDGVTNSMGISVLGESRCGKTRLIEHIESTFPRTRSREGARIPVLRTTIPSVPRIKEIVSRMLKTMGDPSAFRGTTSEMEYRLKTLMEQCGTRMMILDEVQHFIDRSKGYKLVHASTDWLKDFMDETKVITVAAGLPYSEGILFENEQITGRVMAPIYLPRFDWRDPDLRIEFQGILGGFEASMSAYFDLPELSSEQMAFRFFLASGGLVGYVSKILQQATWNVLDDERRVINLEDIDLAYKQAVPGASKGVASPFSREFALNSDVGSIEQALKIGVRGDFLMGLSKMPKNISRSKS